VEELSGTKELRASGKNQEELVPEPALLMRTSRNQQGREPPRTHPLLKFFRVHAERTRKVNEIKNERTGGVFCVNSRFTWLMDSPDNIRNKKELEPLGSLGDLVCPKYILNPKNNARARACISFCPPKKYEISYFLLTCRVGLV
jgi:hypothetical protein